MSILLTFVFSSFSVILLLFDQPFFALAIIATPLAFIILNKNMKIGLYTITAWIPLQYFLSNYYLGILPRSFVWLDEVLLAIMLCIVVSKLTIQRIRCNYSTVDGCVLFFIVWGIISSLVNLVDPLTAILGLRSFLQYYFIYFILKNYNFSEKTYKYISIILIISLLIQVPVSVYEFLTWRPIFYSPLTQGFVNQWSLSYYDAVVGTFGTGAANNFGYLLIMSLFITLSCLYFLKRKIYLLISLLVLIPLIFSQSRGSYFLFFIISIFLFWNPMRQHLIKFLVIFFIVGLSAFALVSLYFKHTHFSFEKFFNLKDIYSQQLEVSSNSSGRLVGISVVNDILFSRPPSPLMGVGPGMFSSTAGNAMRSPLYLQTVRKLNSDRSLTENDIVPLFAEYGYVGVLIFLFTIFSMIKENERHLIEVKNTKLEALLHGGRGVLIVFLIAGLFVRMYQSAYLSFYVWLYLGITENLISIQKNKNRLPQTNII